MFAGAEVGVARDAMRRLMLTPVFDELTKRSLLARIIKLYPELESVITGEQKEEKSAALVVSWSSLDKRKAEYEELVNKKIPENSKEIGIARSYGDLRENFEFKAAKEMQAVLMRRKSELEAALHNARGTAFESPDTSQVSIGTIVTLRDSDSGKEEVYTVLGAWDGDPDRGIISYQTAIGQAMLGHKVGEIVTLSDETRDAALRDHFDRAGAGRCDAARSVADGNSGRAGRGGVARCPVAVALWATRTLLSPFALTPTQSGALRSALDSGVRIQTNGRPSYERSNSYRARRRANLPPAENGESPRPHRRRDRHRQDGDAADAGGKF